MIRIVTILGSVRPDNYTRRAAALVVEEFEAKEDVSHTLIDPAELNLPLPGSDDPGPGVKSMRDAVKQATGIVFASPEYHGGISSVTKLVIDNLGFPSELSGKPIALLGVAAGRIGAIKSLEQIRSICSHVGALVLPGPVSVANVQSVFDGDTCQDPKIEERIRGVADNLLDYIHGHICPKLALEAMIREQELTDAR